MLISKCEKQWKIFISQRTKLPNILLSSPIQLLTSCSFPASQSAKCCEEGARGDDNTVKTNLRPCAGCFQHFERALRVPDDVHRIATSAVIVLNLGTPQKMTF